jgi:hypothetical protein
MRLTNSATFYATLAVTAIIEDFWKGRLASQVSILNNGGQSSPYLPAFHVFKMQAIRELNRMLNDPFERTSDAVILTIMQLIPVEVSLRLFRRSSRAEGSLCLWTRNRGAERASAHSTLYIF